MPDHSDFQQIRGGLRDSEPRTIVSRSKCGGAREVTEDEVTRQTESGGGVTLLITLETCWNLRKWCHWWQSPGKSVSDSQSIHCHGDFIRPLTAC